MTLRSHHSRLAGVRRWSPSDSLNSDILLLMASYFCCSDLLLVLIRAEPAGGSAGGQLGVSGSSAGGSAGSRRRRQPTNETRAAVSLSDRLGIGKNSELRRSQRHHRHPVWTNHHQRPGRLHPPDELGLVGVVQRHQQLGVFADVADKVLEVHQQAVGVDGAEERLAPRLQVLEPRLQAVEEESRGGGGGEGGDGVDFCCCCCCW